MVAILQGLHHGMHALARGGGEESARLLPSSAAKRSGAMSSKNNEEIFLGEMEVAKRIDRVCIAGF